MNIEFYENLLDFNPFSIDNSVNDTLNNTKKNNSSYVIYGGDICKIKKNTTNNKLKIIQTKLIKTLSELQKNTNL